MCGIEPPTSIVGSRAYTTEPDVKENPTNWCTNTTLHPVVQQENHARKQETHTVLEPRTKVWSDRELMTLNLQLEND